MAHATTTQQKEQYKKAFEKMLEFQAEFRNPDPAPADLDYAECMVHLKKMHIIADALSEGYWFLHDYSK